MRLASSARVVLSFAVMSVVLVGTTAYAAKNGEPCKNVGTIEVTNGVTYTCKMSDGKLKWIWTKTTSRATRDQDDVVTGFQVKAIYVVPADGVDHSYDTNGYIAGILDEGSKFLQGQLGMQIPIDRNVIGYDIQYLKSNFTTADFEGSGGVAAGLLAESMALENPGSNRKNYIFFVDVKIFKHGTACGLADSPGITAVVAIWKRVGAIAGRCVGEHRQFDNSVSSTWVHELFHNFGVGHTPDSPCDLMAGAETPKICPTNARITIDKEHTRYAGSSLQGQDIFRLRVWEGSTDKLDLEANCSLNPVPRVDGFNYAYCPTGTQTVGRFKYCGDQSDSVTLEGLVDGHWKSLGSWGPKMYSDGATIDWKCHLGYAGLSKELTVATPGTSLYRWMVNGTESEQFKVIWVR
ncbi:MAG: hypothetical protein ABIQ38_06490 [Ilumatobacteraceae bacterium]